MRACPGHLPSRSGYSTVVTGPLPAWSAAWPTRAVSRGLWRRRAPEPGRSPPSVRHQGLQPDFCSLLGPSPILVVSGPTRGQVSSFLPPLGGCGLCWLQPPGPADRACGLCAGEDFGVVLGRAWTWTLGFVPLLIWPQSGAAAWAGAHMLGGSHGHCSVVWEALLFLFFAYVYFLKWTTIIFTMKGS